MAPAVGWAVRVHASAAGVHGTRSLVALCRVGFGRRADRSTRRAAVLGRVHVSRWAAMVPHSPHVHALRGARGGRRVGAFGHERSDHGRRVGVRRKGQLAPGLADPAGDGLEAEDAEHGLLVGDHVLEEAALLVEVAFARAQPVGAVLLHAQASDGGGLVGAMLDAGSGGHGCAGERLGCVSVWPQNEHGRSQGCSLL